MEMNRRSKLARVRRHAEEEARILAGEFARGAEREREAILAALEFERWLAESCAELAEFGERRRFSGSGSGAH